MVTPTTRCVKGDGFSSTTGGFTRVIIDGKPYPADFVASAPDLHEHLADIVRWVMYPTEGGDAAWSQGIIDRCRTAAERFGIQRPPS